MNNASASPRSGDALLEANRQFYEPLWRGSRLIQPEGFNTWPLVRTLTRPLQPRLEVAPGLRPRLPLEDTHFVDISHAALAKLQARGASALLGLISALPFDDGVFDLVCALDIVEHVDDDDAAFAELSRVAAPGAKLLLSVPLHASQWTAFDDFVGHRRRYEPDELIGKLDQHGFVIAHSAVYGMQPESSRLLDLGMWYLINQRERAMWWYNRVFMPLSVRFQKKLALVDGMIATEGVDEVLLVCHKRGA